MLSKGPELKLGAFHIFARESPSTRLVINATPFEVSGYIVIVHHFFSIDSPNVDMPLSLKIQACKIIGFSFLQKIMTGHMSASPPSLSKHIEISVTGAIFGAFLTRRMEFSSIWDGVLHVRTICPIPPSKCGTNCNTKGS